MELRWRESMDGYFDHTGAAASLVSICADRDQTDDEPRKGVYEPLEAVYDNHVAGSSWVTPRLRA